MFNDRLDQAAFQTAMNELDFNKMKRMIAEGTISFSHYDAITDACMLRHDLPHDRIMELIRELISLGANLEFDATQSKNFKECYANMSASVICATNRESEGIARVYVDLFANYMKHLRGNPTTEIGSPGFNHLFPVLFCAAILKGDKAFLSSPLQLLPPVDLVKRYLTGFDKKNFDLAMSYLEHNKSVPGSYLRELKSHLTEEVATQTHLTEEVTTQTLSGEIAGLKNEVATLTHMVESLKDMLEKALRVGAETPRDQNVHGLFHHKG